MKINVIDTCLWGKTCALSFKYDPDIIKKIKDTFSPRCFYDANTKQWLIPYEHYDKAREVFANELSIQELGNIHLDTLNQNVVLGELPKGFEFKVKPYAHQVDAVKYGVLRDKWFLGDEMGLGKTFEALNIALTKPIKRCFIICGVNGLKYNWYEEVFKYTNKKPYILGQRMTRNGKMRIGLIDERCADLDDIDNNDAFFYITNVESLRNADFAYKLAKACTCDMVVVDEAHKCTNSQSLQGKGLLSLNPKYALMMSGTPLMNKATDLFLILKWLGKEHRNFWEFKNHYVLTKLTELKNGNKFWQEIGYKNLDELQERFGSIMLRRRKDDVLDLPEKIFVNEYVEMSKEQENLYEKMKENVISDIDNITSGNALTRLISMRQATSCPNYLEEGVPCAKLDRMEELVEEALANDKQVIVFSNWTTVTDEIKTRLKKYKPMFITGKENIEKRKEAEDSFQSGKTKVIVGTIGAMGVGITLTSGTVEIFVDEPWTMADKNQAIDREHRISQTKSIIIYTLLTKNTIDEEIHKLLKEKDDLSKALIDSNAIKMLVGNDISDLI